MGRAPDRLAPSITLMLAAFALVIGTRPVLAQGGGQPAQSGSVVPISAELCKDMQEHRVMNTGAPVRCERLRLVRFRFVGFDGKRRADGELVVMDAVADRVLEIFEALHARGFPVASAKLMNRYDGDDDASMNNDNTSSFNVRKVAGSNAISLHAYGLAIDLNPIQNPYVLRSKGSVVVSPKAGADYLLRKNLRPGMAESVVGLFADHGFLVWGGFWNSPDYQHFQVSRILARHLAELSPGEARALFEHRLKAYRACVQAAPGQGEQYRRSCALAD